MIVDSALVSWALYYAVFAAPLDVLVNGSPATTVTLTSAYSWYYGSYPFTKNPADG